MRRGSGKANVKGLSGRRLVLQSAARALLAVALAGALAVPGPAQAQSAQDGADPDEPVQAASAWAGSQAHVALTNGLPAALGTGLSMGLAARWLQPGRWTWGGEVSASSATEYGASWEVTQRDLRARGLLGLQAAMGRGRMALLLGLGVTAVQESRLRNQGERLGLSGEALEQAAWGALASADLLAVVSVPVVGAWAAVVAAGPALHVGQGGARAGWTAQLGVGWLP